MNEYVTKINGYLIKDNEAREKIDGITNNMAIVTGTVTRLSGETSCNTTVNLPSGFTNTNTYVISSCYVTTGNKTFGENMVVSVLNNANQLYIVINGDVLETDLTYNFEIVILKIESEE